MSFKKSVGITGVLLLILACGSFTAPRELCAAQPGPLPEGSVARLPSAGTLVVYCPDGKSLLAPAEKDAHTLVRWDVETRKPLRSFVGPKKPGMLFGTMVGFNAASFSKSGAILATGSSDGSLRIWNVADGKQLQEWDGHKDFVHVLDLSADGKTLVSHGWKGRDGAVKVWDTSTGKERHELTEKGNSMPKIPALSPAADLVAVANDSTQELAIWDAATGKQTHRYPVFKGGNQVGVAFHPDGKSVFVTSFGDRGGIRRYDVATGKELAVIASQRDIRSVSFSKDFSIVAAVTQGEKIVNIWEVATGKLRHALTADTDLWTVSMAPDGRMLATHGDGTAGVLLWKLPEAR